MEGCAGLLEEAFALATLEEEALKEEDVEQAEVFFALRQQVLDEVWEQRDAFDTPVLHEALSRMLTIQEHLTEVATALRDSVKETLVTSKKQAQYFGGYRTLMTEENKAQLYSTRT